MKIQTLLEDIIPTRQNVSINRELDGDRDPDKRNNLGMGHFSVARQDRDPHMVKKYNHNFDEHDPFRDYIEYLIDNNLTNNPYFPRIYNIKTISDPKGRQAHKYTIEKMISPLELSAEEMEMVVERTFSQEVAKDIMESASDPHNIAFYHNNKAYAIHSMWTINVKSAIDYGDVSNITDESLQEAVKVIGSIIKQFKATNDLHGKNVLYRRTKFGVQPVLADPIA